MISHLQKSLLTTICLAIFCSQSAQAAEQFDVVVVGATPGGIATAITAARFGRSVALVEYHNHVGGMSASGLGKSDILTRSAVAGLFTEFTDRVRDDYIARYGKDSQQVKQCRDGYFYEPSVAERIFRQMLTEQTTIRLFTGHRLEEAIRHRRRLVGIRCLKRKTKKLIEFRGRVFIDATYEGDLAAYAGARYRLGRESRGEFDESHAGVIYMDHSTLTLLPGSTGLGDHRLPAYTFRLCLSTDPENSMPIPKPTDYDRERYKNYFADLKLKRLDTAVRALSISPIPNQKTDVNMKPWPLGFPFANENYDYPEAGWDEREKITQRIRNITLGLVYFLQNDPQLPAQDRVRARKYGLAKDEFSDNNNFPWQLYVREARRVIGMYTITEHDLVRAPGLMRAPIQHDAIAAAAFPIDSFPTQKREPGRDRALEGYLFMMRNITQPYQIPYRSIVPADVDGLLTPVPLSATHIAFSAIRMEPTWMAIGQAAGTAAHMSIEQNLPLRKLPVAGLQRKLIDDGQVITHFGDRTKTGEFAASIQYFGTKGFYTDYQARPRSPITRAAAARWLSLALDVTGNQLRAGKSSSAHWRDFGPDNEHFTEAAALSIVGILPAAHGENLFRPDDQLTVAEFCRWLKNTGALLRLLKPVRSSKPTALSILKANNLGPATWCRGDTAPQNLDRPLLRGEACRALFELLKRAGH